MRYSKSGCNISTGNNTIQFSLWIAWPWHDGSLSGLKDPDNYAGGSIAIGRASLSKQTKNEDPDKDNLKEDTKSTEERAFDSQSRVNGRDILQVSGSNNICMLNWRQHRAIRFKMALDWISLGAIQCITATTGVLWCGKKMETLPHNYYLWRLWSANDGLSWSKIFQKYKTPHRWEAERSIAK